MADNKTIKVGIFSEKGIIHYGDCTTLFVPSDVGMIAILPYHTPMIMKLSPGTVSIKSGHVKQDITTVKSGLVYVGENEASVLVDL